MQLPFLITIAQFDWLGGTIGVIISVVLSFLTITLIASYYRFQHIIEQAEEMNPEEMGTSASEILRVQMARYLAGCARRNTSFSISLIRIGIPGFHLGMDAPLIGSLKHAVRCDDVVCVYDDQTAALFTEAEPEDAVSMLTRITAAASACSDAINLKELRVGIASYPGHGLSGIELLGVASEALEETTFEEPIVLPEIIDIDAEEEEAPEEEPGIEAEDIDDEVLEEEPDDEPPEEDLDERKSRKERRKEAILDPVTGVLKPSVLSAYMQRMLSDLRYKKQRAALFCIGVNNMDHILRFHGEDTADDVLAGVSHILQKNLRADDLIGRHEKFAFLVLAKCSLEEAESIGRRISMLIQQSQFESGHKKLKTTITLGVATYPEHGRNLHHLYEAGQKVLDHSRNNDIRAYAVYDPEIHDKVPVKPMRSIKSIKA